MSKSTSWSCYEYYDVCECVQNTKYLVLQLCNCILMCPVCTAGGGDYSAVHIGKLLPTGLAELATFNLRFLCLTPLSGQTLDPASSIPPCQTCDSVCFQILTRKRGEEKHARGKTELGSL